MTKPGSTNGSASSIEFVHDGNLPALIILRLPNDHTSGTYPGALTPQAYVAQNDHALGRVVDIVSHSRYWASTAIFSIEDDSQNGPDHVDDQRTTFYLASPYAAPGVHHAQYTTSSVLRTIELLLGLPAMTIYDALAPPMYDAFALQPDCGPMTSSRRRSTTRRKTFAPLTEQRRASGWISATRTQPIRACSTTSSRTSRDTYHGGDAARTRRHDVRGFSGRVRRGRNHRDGRRHNPRVAPRACWDGCSNACIDRARRRIFAAARERCSAPVDRTDRRSVLDPLRGALAAQGRLTLCRAPADARRGGDLRARSFALAYRTGAGLCRRLPGRLR